MTGYPYLIVVTDAGYPVYAEPYPDLVSAESRLRDFDQDPDASSHAVLMDLTNDGAGEPLYSPDDSGMPDDAP